MNLKMDSGNRVHFCSLRSSKLQPKGEIVIKVNPASINDLLALKEAGVPVTLTSHPGNASLYKLSLWSCGIPEHLWDITCCKADANNWPMHRLQNGEAELIIPDELHRRILQTTSVTNRFVTAYQFTKTGERLGRFHVAAKQKCFPGAISSCSRLKLTQKEKIWEMFDYLARTRPDDVFTRFITSDGVMQPMARSGIRPENMATSFMYVLEELDHLLFSDEPMSTKGGACHDGIMVPLSDMLAQYWQTGKYERYDISGPDMINYATRPEHAEKLSEMLAHLRKWKPELIPPHITIHMFPGTMARVGYIPGHASEHIMDRKWFVLDHPGIGSDLKLKLREMAQNDEREWPIEIKPNQDHYFSQHDLISLDGKIVVNNFWKKLPIANLRDNLLRANAILRLHQK